MRSPSGPRRPDPADFSGRQLAFHPADPAAARTLTTEQVEAFDRDGFVAPVDVLDAGETTALRDYVDGLLAAVTGAGDGRDAYAINGYHVTCAGLWDLATHPRITALVRDLLGSEVVCWGTHLFAKLPGDGKEVPFHQDAVYWPFTPSRTVTVWLAVDDVDEGNAAVQFVPGSHLGGPIVHEELPLDGSRVLARRATGLDAWPARYVDALRAGQASLHCDLLLHGSDANRSDRRRAGLTLRYAAAQVQVLEGYEEWRAAAVHVLDGDPSGSWPHRPRPPGEDPGALAPGTGVDAG